MPLFMDVHTIDGGVATDEVAKAHQADLDKQGDHDVRYLQYWVAENEGKIFCLVDAPSADAASTVWTSMYSGISCSLSSCAGART